MSEMVIGKYKVIGSLGEGGMGAVYLAEHTLIGRKAALKVLLPELSHREDVVKRFFNEARAATAARHPSIVEIYDFGYHTDGSAFIVMEYLEGETLAARITRLGRLTEAEALRIARQVASALLAAHDKGVVHRDLKPDNIFLVPDPDLPGRERVKVLDFGIAKLTDDGTGAASNTRTGVIMGTPQFMSPEQCRGAGSVDWRTDIYALGCILFDMVCGAPPFQAAGSGEIIAQHIMTPPPAPRSIAQVSQPLEALILQLLAKNPDERAREKRDVLTWLEQLSPATGEHSAAKATVMAPSGYVGPTPAPTMPVTGAPRVTTLSAATGTQTAPPPARRRSMVLPILAGVVAIGGVVAFLVLRGGSTQSPASAAAPADDHMVVHPVVAPEPPKPEPPPEPEPPKQPEAQTPSTVSLRIESDPKGAEVYRMPQAVRVGKTPLHLDVPQATGEAVFLIKKHGYKDSQIAMRLDTNVVREVALERVHRRHPPKKPPQVENPVAKPPVGNTLNPFEK